MIDLQHGVCCIVERGGRYLLGRRTGAHGAGSWAFPGGKIDPGEDLAGSAVRELAEETGLSADPASAELVAETIDHFPEGVSFHTYFLRLKASGQPVILEPEKCLAWEWFSWEELPRPLFLSIENLRAQGFRPRT